MDAPFEEEKSFEEDAPMEDEQRFEDTHAAIEFDYEDGAQFEEQFEQ